MRQCTKPFKSLEDAEAFMTKRGFAGHILKGHNGYAAVCPARPDAFYPDAVLVKVEGQVKGRAQWAQ
jgi:hypothetical protein